jgi:hypothetical protein
MVLPFAMNSTRHNTTKQETRAKQSIKQDPEQSESVGKGESVGSVVRSFSSRIGIEQE